MLAISITVWLLVATPRQYETPLVMKEFSDEQSCKDIKVILDAARSPADWPIYRGVTCKKVNVPGRISG